MGANFFTDNQTEIPNVCRCGNYWDNAVAELSVTKNRGYIRHCKVNIIQRVK